MLSTLLQGIRQTDPQYFASVIDVPLNPHIVFDLGVNNTDLQTLDRTNPAEFTPYLRGLLQEHQVPLAIGGYLEKRSIYKTNLFVDQEIPRDIHLGVDLRCDAQTKVFALCDGIVHSIADNAHDGDYGPTIILQHEMDGVIWYSLYGHLSRTSLDLVSEGMKVQAGGHIGYVGPYPENGNRPPHLHFQLIHDMQGKYGDYPGVCRDVAEERVGYANNCPNPNIVLGLVY